MGYYDEDRLCPVFNSVISADVCYECIMGLHKYVNAESVPELRNLENIDESRKICESCPRSNLE